MKNQFITMMVISFLGITLNLNAANQKKHPHSKTNNSSFKPQIFKSPKGNWMADVDINLGIVIIKTVSCDQSSDAVCTRKTNTNSAPGEVLIEGQINGDYFPLCKGVLIGTETNDEETWIKLTFDVDGYENY